MDTMKVVETAGKVKDFIWTVGLIIVGAAFILFGVLSIKSGIEANSKSYGEAEAVITAIEEELVSEDVDDGATYEYTVLVSYTVNGETYADINLGYYTAGMTEGDKVTVQYDLQDPSQLKSQSAGFMGYIMLIVGLAAVGYGVFRFAKKNRASKTVNMIG